VRRLRLVLAVLLKHGRLFVLIWIRQVKLKSAFPKRDFRRSGSKFSSLGAIIKGL
jgi:hypothetical protein